MKYLLLHTSCPIIRIRNFYLFIEDCNSLNRHSITSSPSIFTYSSEQKINIYIYFILTTNDCILIFVFPYLCANREREERLENLQNASVWERSHYETSCVLYKVLYATKQELEESTSINTPSLLIIRISQHCKAKPCKYKYPCNNNKRNL